MTGMAPEKGAGVVPIVYMTSFPPFGGGVHSMVTLDCPIPWMEGMDLLRRTLVGGPVGRAINNYMLTGYWYSRLTSQTCEISEKSVLQKHR